MTVCMKLGCYTHLNDPGVIRTTTPCWIGGKWIMVHLCRTCFLETDSYRADELIAWLKVKKDDR